MLSVRFAPIILNLLLRAVTIIILPILGGLGVAFIFQQTLLLDIAAREFLIGTAISASLGTGGCLIVYSVWKAGDYVRDVMTLPGRYAMALRQSAAAESVFHDLHIALLQSESARVEEELEVEDIDDLHRRRSVKDASSIPSPRDILNRARIWLSYNAILKIERFLEELEDFDDRRRGDVRRGSVQYENDGDYIVERRRLVAKVEWRIAAILRAELSYDDP